jgi:hypothetical protein
MAADARFDPITRHDVTVTCVRSTFVVATPVAD